MPKDRLEFDSIHETFRPRIRRYLARMVGEQDAEDLTQEVFVRVSRGLGSFRGESQLSTWVYRIATNAAVDRLRTPSFQRTSAVGYPDDSVERDPLEVDDSDIWTGERTPSVEQEQVRKEMNECVRDSIGRLPEKYRTVLVLSEVEGLANQEIADILAVSLHTVKIRLHRARLKLKQDLVAHCEMYWVEENEYLPDLKGLLKDL